MKYIQVPEPHGFLIWRGKQKAIASDQPLLTDEKALVVSGGQAFGEVILSQPLVANLSEFERLEKEHTVRPEERRLNFPNQDVFYIHRFKAFEPYAETKMVTIENGDAEILEEANLTEEQQTLIEKAERLPKNLILSEDVVVLTEEGYQIAEGLDSAKIEPLLKAIFEDAKSADDLPLYQLALVRKPRLGFKKESMKPYKIMMNQGDCEGHAVVKKSDGEVMGCHETHEEAMTQMTALYEAEDKGGPGSGRYPKGSGKPKKTTSPNAKPPKEAGRGKEYEEMDEDEKSVSLDSKLGAIREGFYNQFNPQPKQEMSREKYYWLKEIYDDHAVVGVDGKIYKATYTTDEEGKVKFADKSKWAELEVQLVPTGNIGAKSYEEALNIKSFSEWLDDYYELGTKELSDLTEEEAVKAVWSAKFVNQLPDSSFLYVKPGCGEKDEDGLTKPRSCRMFPVKDAKGNPDMPHIRNAIARATQSDLPEDVQKKIQNMAKRMLKEDEGEKAGRRVKKSMVDKIKAAFETLKEFMSWAEKQDMMDEDEEEMMKSIFTDGSPVGIKQVGDKWWYFTYSTNAFKDREKEIFSTKSLEKYVEQAEKSEDRGYFNFWHIQTKDHPTLTDFAKKEWQGVAGRFLIEGGPFLDNEMGQKFLKFFKKYSENHPTLAPEGWGCSPEYKYLPEERKKGIYENIWITRTSTLPKMSAANIWTLGGNVMALSAEQKKALETILGKEDAEKVVSLAETKTKELEEAGVGHKGVGETQEETEGSTTVILEQDKVVEAVAQLVVTQLGEKMTADWKPLQEVLEKVVQNQEAQKAEIEQLRTEVQGAKQFEAAKTQAESPKYVWSLVQRASEADKTIVPEGDALKDKKPVEAQKSDKSGASAFFGR